ncbi:MAG: hypothetical protein AB1779_05210, partial [Candidatus Thermoplasmatota archaeon]
SFPLIFYHWLMYKEEKKVKDICGVFSGFWAFFAAILIYFSAPGFFLFFGMFFIIGLGKIVQYRLGRERHELCIGIFIITIIFILLISSSQV